MRIVVGVDGSEPAKRAVEWCAAYAGALDAEIVAVHAIDTLIYQDTVGLRLPVPPPSPEYRAELKEHVETVWCAPLATANVPYRVTLADGDPARAIMQTARTEQADLVVTGRRGRGGFAELVLGSTSHALSHHLECPLVIVP
jgi:nucleotide-binding universal stress UspA family protein